MEKLKILQLVPRFPFPLDDGGKIGIANIFKQFSKQGANVTLFSLNHEQINQEDIEEAQKYGKTIILPHNTKNTTKRIISSLIFQKSIYLKKHISNKIISEISKLIQPQNFDIIHADHTCMAPLALYAKEKFNIPVGLRLHNIEYSIWERYANELKNINPKKYYINQQSKILKKAEAQIIKQVDINFAITEPDRKKALELAPNANVIVATAGVNPEEWTPDDSIQRNPKEIILATTYHWIHNTNALKWFLNEVFPIVLKKIPDAQLTLIGKEAPQWLIKYYPKNIKLIGYVDKVQPYYNKASINISPLFVGGGIRIKILEAMAMELPVIATSLAAEGIQKPNSGLFITDNSQDFAHHIINLIINHEFARKSGKTARKFITQNYSWSKNVQTILNEYKKLITKP